MIRSNNNLYNKFRIIKTNLYDLTYYIRAKKQIFQIAQIINEKIIDEILNKRFNLNMLNLKIHYTKNLKPHIIMLKNEKCVIENVNEKRCAAFFQTK